MNRSSNLLTFVGKEKTSELPETQKSDSFKLNYTQNDKNDVFLKDYLVNSIAKKGIKKPSSVSISVYAPDIEKNPNPGFSEVAYGPYGGYVEDFFDLMYQDKASFTKRIGNIKGNKPLQDKLGGLYNYLDNYYKLEVTLMNSKKPYNLFDLSDKDKKELMNVATAEEKPFVEEAIANVPELKEVAFKFSRSEAKRKTLSVAGEDSRGFIKALVIGTLALFGLEKIKAPLIARVGGEASLIGKPLGIATEFAGGVGDDALACIKDYEQDKVSIGKPAAKVALVSSLALAIGAGSFILGKFKIDTLKGAIGYSIVSSVGSIWGNSFAFALMQKKQKGMKDNGLIVSEKNESSLAKTWKNYIGYDAYLGKVIGILSCVPIAIFAQKKGYLAKEGKDFVKPLVASIWLTLIGSGETFITAVIQSLRDSNRKSKINDAKKAIAADPDKAKHYSAHTNKIKTA